MKDENDILIEDGILKAISFSGGIYGTSDVLFGAVNLIGKRTLKKINFKIKTWEQDDV